MTAKEAFQELYDDLDVYGKVRIFNDYCRYTDNYEDILYNNNEYFFKENFMEIDEAVRAVCYGDYHYRDEFVCFDAYGNLRSTNYPNEYIDMFIDEMAEKFDKGDFSWTDEITEKEFKEQLKEE